MRYLTAGESHGPQLTVIIEGLPSQLSLDKEKIDRELARRQKGYGRGRRMQIEKDQVKILSGVRFGKTTGAPVTLVIENRDFTHWKKVMSVDPIPEEAEKRKISRPRPGHADLNGAIKYQHRDMRDVLERSSARETAARVAAGAVARLILEECGIRIAGHVIRIGDVVAEPVDLSFEEMVERAELSPVRCLDQNAEEKMMALIDQAKKEGDSLGGVVETIVQGVPVGLGSHVHWDRKLDAKIARAVVSINAFKGVEFGIGFEAAKRKGSEVHDEILWSKERGFYRRTNRLGGLEGGMTTGEPIIVRGVMKPIPTLYKPLQSVDIETKEPFQASIERSDSCAVPAASVVMENVVAWEVAQALMDKFSGDTMDEVKQQLKQYRERVLSF
ncbi:MULTISPECIES: chorismate synthase [Thermoactinomyces]|jgi:chorismate synthase|uniref:Chorismate synthase n=1 Tax=Thermoactinomyces vulgaris TaxID=2026 RepID=A0ABS0QDN1_THEVU|nr:MULTISPECIES: chorismate synthase [Thermoactinomyces]KFZ40530.1 chorismate synthase [Thermoactinomyces sp. Gus2-1]KYQ87846.1 chorismate synthase [Thermoactinomyces sp. AS95]MBA4550427.1 chorismate synthase [Thermoactinomyces vulgaris]MBA4595838.1 chorismate synthase [Thermoactinomyces vulgaris]MBH8587377.1 chorismate synthase [Thermoactinomyces vulgaris]